MDVADGDTNFYEAKRKSQNREAQRRYSKHGSSSFLFVSLLLFLLPSHLSVVGSAVEGNRTRTPIFT